MAANIIYLKGKFSAAPRICFNFFLFNFSLALKYYLQSILDISVITVDTETKTLDTDALIVRLTTGRMQFSFTIQSLVFYFCRITFICRIELVS
jgi:hypothetical protein